MIEKYLKNPLNSTIDFVFVDDHNERQMMRKIIS
jgi:hypothetical protein